MVVEVTSIGCSDMRRPLRTRRRGIRRRGRRQAEDHLRRVIPSATIIRPGGLRSAPPTGRGILTQDPQMHGFINRGDVVELVARALDDRATSGHTFAAVDADAAQTINAIVPFRRRGLPAI
jgi:hypothetical protein